MILEVVDCVDWAVASLVRPLKKLGVDIAYHYVNTSKGTGTGEENPVHLTLDLMKKYDTIHFHAGHNFDALLKNKEALKILENKRIIFTMHNERDAVKYAQDSKWKIIDTIVCPTHYLEEVFKFKTKYIPYAIDEKKYSFTSDYPRSTNTIGYVGRVVPHKNLKRIVEDSEGFQVVGIGYVDNDGAEYWKTIPKENLTMYQNLSEDEKIEIMRNFTVLVSISEPHIETGPLGVLEAAALGIPIVSTYVGWVKDNLDYRSFWPINETNYNGKTLSIKDIKIMMDLPVGALKLMAENARKVIDNWTLDMYINAHKKVYKGELSNQQ